MSPDQALSPSGLRVQDCARAESPGSARPMSQPPEVPRGSPSASEEPSVAQVSAAGAGPDQPASAPAGTR